MKLLNEAEFLAAFSAPMKRVVGDAVPPFDFWNYFEAIPKADFAEHDCSTCSVSYVYEDSTQRFQHVPVNSEDKNIFMAIVLDLQNKTVFGHRLLDLKREYGLDSSK